MILKTADENVEFYISSLAIGILLGIKEGTLSTDVGIWSLGRPAFQNMIQASQVSERLKCALGLFDELDAVKSLGGNLEATIQRLLDDLIYCQKQAALEGINFRIEAAR